MGTSSQEPIIDGGEMRVIFLVIYVLGSCRTLRLSGEFTSPLEPFVRLAEGLGNAQQERELLGSLFVLGNGSH
jgi:hypothetical protein